ncbi:phosphodiesterase [Pectinatus sottacetonis]|uniref:phosphodiesterase n=1 Tax=Pectinatus sottacetonis TaxID=1002795 RepID=UPI0018C4C19A|nr:phosphodiesterase [Pectinatus sottacetonis]
MKIGIISDTHGCVDRFSLAYEKLFKDSDMIIHAGDVLYHGPRNPMLPDYNPAKLAEKINSLPMPIIIAKGNCDSEVDQLVLNTPIQAPYTYVVVNGLKIITTHGHHVMSDKEKDTMAAHLKADIFISGHVHINVLEKRGKTIFLNPGSPSLSKRTDKKQTAAILTDKEIEIIDIDSGEIIMSLKR